MTSTAAIELATQRPLWSTPLKPLTAGDALPPGVTRHISPDGKYGIACTTQPLAILFNQQTSAVIATGNEFSFCNDNGYYWAADSSSVFTFTPTGTVQRWYTAGGRLETTEVNVPLDLRCIDSNNHAALSPDRQYLAVVKGCQAYLVRLSDPASFHHPQAIEKPSIGGISDLRWVTPHLVMMTVGQTYDFYQAPAGNRITSIVAGGGSGCTNQLPSLSPEERWMIFETMQCGADTPTRLILADLKTGILKIIPETAEDYFDLIGWKPDSSGFMLIRRPQHLIPPATSRSGFGLLEFDPQAGQFKVQNDKVLLAVFPRDRSQPYVTFQKQTPETPAFVGQAWSDAFPRDFSHAFVAFPVRAADGSIRLDGALWDTSTGGLSGNQVLAKALPDKFPSYSGDVGYMVSPAGKEIAYSARAVYPPLIAVWSHDNQRLATINADHQLVIIDLDGKTQTPGRVSANLEESNWTLRGRIVWSDDDRIIKVGDQEWTVD